MRFTTPNGTWHMTKNVDGDPEYYFASVPDLSKIETTTLLTSEEKMAKKVKSTAVTTAEKRVIETSLVNKEEVFRMMALAEATGLPLLLVGAPGVGKTKTVIEYAKAWLNKDAAMTAQDFQNKLFILETDEGTKASEVKGMPDLGKLFTDNKYEIAAPIANADIVMINEVDKASSNVRNSLLGVMNEKFLFNGKHKIPCKWKLFVATCNEIPKEEKDSPFWDRFMLKMTVNRIQMGELLQYFESGAKDYKSVINLGVPNKAELDSVEIGGSKMEKYLSVTYNISTDRTLTFVPTIAKAVSYIWNYSIDKALIKTAQIMAGSTAGDELANSLISRHLKSLLKEVENLYHLSDAAELDLAIAKIEGMASGFAAQGNLDEEQMDEVENTLNYVLENHPVKKRSSEIETLLEDAMASMESAGDIQVPRPF